MKLNKADTRKPEVISPQHTNVKRLCIPSPPPPQPHSKAWRGTGMESPEVSVPQTLGSYTAHLDFLEMPEPKLELLQARSLALTAPSVGNGGRAFILVSYSRAELHPDPGQSCPFTWVQTSPFSHPSRRRVGGGGVSQFPHVSLSVLFWWIWEVGRGEEISSPTRSTSWVEIEALKKKEIWMVWLKLNILKREWWKLKLESYFRIMKSDKWLNFGQNDCHPPDSDLIVPWIFSGRGDFYVKSATDRSI